MKTPHDQTPQFVENSERDAENLALDRLDRNVGMNYDAGFGSLLEDTAAADMARTRSDHRIIEE
jgi:hypothetical protein